MFRILVVEDDREQNRTVCTYLRHNGYDAVGWPGRKRRLRRAVRRGAV